MWGHRSLKKKCGGIEVWKEKKVANKNNAAVWGYRCVESWEKKKKWEIKMMEQCWGTEVWKVGKESGK